MQNIWWNERVRKDLFYFPFTYLFLNEHFFPYINIAVLRLCVLFAWVRRGHMIECIRNGKTLECDITYIVLLFTFLSDWFFRNVCKLFSVKLHSTQAALFIKRFFIFLCMRFIVLYKLSLFFFNVKDLFVCL